MEINIYHPNGHGFGKHATANTEIGRVEQVYALFVYRSFVVIVMLYM